MEVDQPTHMSIGRKTLCCTLTSPILGPVCRETENIEKLSYGCTGNRRKESPSLTATAKRLIENALTSAQLNMRDYRADEGRYELLGVLHLDLDGITAVTTAPA